MEETKKSLVLVNFGGPRHLAEVTPFLEELLTDRDVIRSSLPKWFFRYIARKRAMKISHDYALIGGRSPIFFDTESMAQALGATTFHRYLPATHAESLEKIENLQGSIVILPLFPQFTYATSGSIARFFSRHLSKKTLAKLSWIPSYPDHPAYISAMTRAIQEYLDTQHLKANDVCFLFSAHGLPKAFIETGDPYREECERSFRAISNAFPEGESLLSFQSKFGRGEWLRPYTEDVCRNLTTKKEHVVVIPLSFTSDHIETLFEIEYQYLPLIRATNRCAYRCPALNCAPYWIDALKEITTSSSTTNETLIYEKRPLQTSL